MYLVPLIHVKNYLNVRLAKIGIKCQRNGPIVYEISVLTQHIIQR